MRISGWSSDVCSSDLRLWSRLPLALFAGAAVLFGLILFGGKVGILPLLGMTVAGIVAVASLAPLLGRNLRRIPLPTWGMVVAHFGVADCLAGRGAESAFNKTGRASCRERGCQVVEISVVAASCNTKRHTD